MSTNRFNFFLGSLCAAATLMVATPAAFAETGELDSNTAVVGLSATLAESLTVSATPATVNFALVSKGGVAP